MKRHFEHPAPSQRELTGPRYWRSLEELAETPGFKSHLEREFPEGASEMDGVDRRHFFKIMAASFALGGVGLAGCRRPEAHILPYGKSQNGVTPGLPLYFATAMPARGGAIPLLAETHQGRPTKLEGNPSYAPNGGASNLTSQASILDLYDPDRSTNSKHGSSTLTTAQVNDLLAGVHTKYAVTDGAGLAFIAEESASPTRAALVKALRKKMPKAVWAEYDAIDISAPRAAATAAFGESAKPIYHFEKAKRVLSLDCDFLQSEPGSIRNARAWAAGRRIAKAGDEMARLYIAESHFTITGSNADHRLRLSSSHIPAFTALVAAKVFTKTGKFSSLGAKLESLVSGLKVEARWLDACVDDLVKNGSRSLVVAGAHQSAGVHVLVLAINEALGSLGTTITVVEVPENKAASIQQLAASIKAGSVNTLVVLGANPVYNAPAELGWAALQKSVSEVIHLGLYRDETGLLATHHINAAHYLETWGDARTTEGTILPVQPMILPLFDGLSEIEVLARVLGDSVTDGYGLVHRTFAAAKSSDTEKQFRAFLHDGLVSGSEYPVLKGGVRASALALIDTIPAAPVLSASSLEVRFAADIKVDDGRFANNGWLQECPEPITKISWDNAIQVSPALAAELGLVAANRVGGEGHASPFTSPAREAINDFEIGKQIAPVYSLTINGRTVEGPIHIQPGLANYTVVVPLGYGREIGRISSGTGFNAYPLRASDGLSIATGAKLARVAGKTRKLANTQEHWSIEGRDIVREANAAENAENPNWAHSFGMESHTPPNYGEGNSNADLAKLSPEERAKRIGELASKTPRGQSLYEIPNLTGLQQWGMSIDLNTCIGCNACVVACQAENNIPIVGKDQVLRGREMHWIRLDRYYATGSNDNAQIPEDPQVVIQPMTCQHCEAAPCESVCPVNATVHDEEGLNVMAYNRCIGTRYCANNCPYKVRRFNYFDWQQRQLDSLYMGPLGPKGKPELLQMAQNPDVTVRMRGVMEKCTYCVQRIERAKIDQKAKVGASGDVTVPDGKLKTACQQVCPTEAIVFGDILDTQSAVSKAKADPRTYAVLGYLNVRPRTTYIGKVRNPNPEMPDYASMPLTRLEYENKNHPGGHESHGAESKGGHH